MKRLLRSLPALALALPACGESFSYDANSFFPEDWQDSYVKKFDCKESVTHGNDHVIVYVSPDAEAAYADRTTEMPTGSVILKEQYSDSSCSDLTAYTVMRKLEAGANTEQGDYEWQRVESSGEISVSGDATISNCTSCHTNCEGGDFLCEPAP